MEFPVVSSHLTPPDLRALVQAIADSKSGATLRETQGRFLEGLGSEILVGVTASFAVDFIRLLFTRWREKRSSQERKTPVMIIVMPLRRLRIDCPEDLPDAQELAGEKIEEVRLELED